MSSSSFPSGREIRESILTILNDFPIGIESGDLFLHVCSLLKITDDNLKVLIPNSNRGVFAYRFSWAKSELKKAKKIEQNKNGRLILIK